MNSEYFEIVLPAINTVSDEEAFQMLEIQATKLHLSPKLRKRFCIVGMELFQNLVRHRLPGHLSVLKVRKEEGNILSVLTMNLAVGAHSEKLIKKFQHLEKTSNLKEHFQKKLSFKAESNHLKEGDLGLEICFRYTDGSSVHSFDLSPDYQIIYIAFYLHMI